MPYTESLTSRLVTHGSSRLKRFLPPGVRRSDPQARLNWLQQTVCYRKTSVVEAIVRATSGDLNGRTNFASMPFKIVEVLSASCSGSMHLFKGGEEGPSDIVKDRLIRLFPNAS